MAPRPERAVSIYRGFRILDCSGRHTTIALRSYSIMASEPQKKRVLITGCSPGSIGEALAQEFLSIDGSRPILSLVTILANLVPEIVVCVTSLPGENLKELEGLGALVYPVDVTSSESVKALRNAVTKDLGEQLDVLINCAYVILPAMRFWTLSK